MLTVLTEWLLHLDVLEAAVHSLVANAVVFGLALALGEVIARIWRQRPVALPPPPLSRIEVVLAAACVCLNSAVMLAGWALFRAHVIETSVATHPLQWLRDAVVLLLVMDLAMYVTHRFAHHPLAFRFVHGIHHRYDAPRPLTLFVLHPLEVLGFGGLWLLVLSTYRYSLGGVLIYLTLNIAFGLLGHVGVEPLPQAFVRWRAARLVGTSTFHVRHHQTPTSNFGFYTTLWDRVFRTLDSTYESTFAAAPAAPPPTPGTTPRSSRVEPQRLPVGFDP